MNSFLDLLLGFDIALFQKINLTWTHAIADSFFVFITLAHKNPIFLYGILPCILAFWGYRDRSRALKIFMVTAVTIAASDALSHRVIKQIVKRPRPHHVASVTHSQLKLGYSPSGYSFTSNHASNNFAGAYILSRFYPGIGFFLFLYASLVAYSRPYVGVHYPSDILAGALLGVIIGWILYSQVWRPFLGPWIHSRGDSEYD